MRFLKGAKQQMSQSISALPVRAKVKDTSTTYYGVPIIWEIGDKNHAGYPAWFLSPISQMIGTP